MGCWEESLESVKRNSYRAPRRPTNNGQLGLTWSFQERQHVWQTTASQISIWSACIFDSRLDCSLNGSLQGKPRSLIRHVHPDISQVWNMFGFWLSRLTPPLLAWWSPNPGSDVEDFPSLCLHSKTLERLTECLEEFIVPRGFYDRVSYNAAQPDISQRAAWSSVISSLLHIDGNCSSIQVPDSLKGIYDVVTFTENTGASFCVFFELTADCHAYRKGWGAMIVPARREAVSRDVHISAPHPGFDVGTPAQAAYIFKATGSKSLLIAGRTRTAFLNPSPCISTGSLSGYYETDPAHNNVPLSQSFIHAVHIC